MAEGPEAAPKGVGSVGKGGANGGRFHWRRSERRRSIVEEGSAIPGWSVVVASISDIIGRSLPSARAIAVTIVALFSLGFLVSFERRESVAIGLSSRDLTPAVSGHSAPADRPSTPSAALPFSGIFDPVEEESEGGDLSELRFVAERGAAKRAEERAARPDHPGSTTALVARAADYGRLCRRLL